jgi:pimeloyl-ACP methyl ester carboxylesterase
MDTDVRTFQDAQTRLLARHGLDAAVHRVPAPSAEGEAGVVVTGQGPPLVLVIGGGVPAAMWAPLVEAMPGYTHHFVELPGHGNGDRIAWTTGRFLAVAHHFLGEVLDGLGLPGPIPLVGSSLGGHLALRLAHAAPDRVSSLTLIGTPAFAGGTSAPLPLRLVATPGLGAVLTRLQPPSEAGVRRFGAVAGEDLTRHPELAALMLAQQRLPGHVHDLRQLLASVLTPRGARPEVRLPDSFLGQVAVPSRLVWGRRERFGPLAACHRIVGALPRAELRLVEGGHGPWLDDPLGVARLVLTAAGRERG